MPSVVPSAAAASGDAGAPSVVTTTTTPAILRSLQNGSDVRGVALEGVPNEPVTLNEEAAYLIGAAFADWLAAKTGDPPESLSIAVGRDPRLSGPALANAMFAGFASRGVGRLIDLGLATTPEGEERDDEEGDQANGPEDGGIERQPGSAAGREDVVDAGAGEGRDLLEGVVVGPVGLDQGLGVEVEVAPVQADEPAGVHVPPEHGEVVLLDRGEVGLTNTRFCGSVGQGTSLPPTLCPQRLSDSGHAGRG